MKEKIKNFFSPEDLFTTESAVRHLLMLAVAVVLYLYNFWFISIAANDNMFAVMWNFQEVPFHEVIAVVCFNVLAPAIWAIPVYWNIREWMFPFLWKALLYFLGMIPLVNFFIPDPYKTRWFQRMDDQYESDSIVSEHSVGFGYKLVTKDMDTPILLSWLFGIIGGLFHGVGCVAGFLLGALILPVISPLFMFLVMWAVSMVIDWNVIVGTILGILFLIACVLLYIVHPILCFVKKN